VRVRAVVSGHPSRPQRQLHPGYQI